MWQARSHLGSSVGSSIGSGGAAAHDGDQVAALAESTGTGAAQHTASGRRVERSDRSRPVAPAAFHLHATSARPPKAADPVSVLIPVRHDTDTAMTAVTAALGQRGVDRLDVVVLDEGCPADTRAALRREFGDDPRVRILLSAPLPSGWSPRAHRGHQLAVAARGRVLLFAEACAPLGPDAAAAAAALLRGERLDLAVLDTGRPRPADDVAKPPPAAGLSTGASVGAGTAGTGTGTGRGGGSTGTGSRTGSGFGTTGGRSAADSRASSPSQLDSASAGPHADAHPAPRSAAARRFQNSRFQSVRTHPGRFAVAVDAGAYWRFGGYRAAAADSDPMALLRTMRRASGRVAVADGRRVIPPAVLVDPAAPEGGWGYNAVGFRYGAGAGNGNGTGTGIPTGSLTNRSPFVDITDTARRLLAALSPARR